MTGSREGRFVSWPREDGPWPGRPSVRLLLEHNFRLRAIGLRAGAGEARGDGQANEGDQQGSEDCRATRARGARIGMLCIHGRCPANRAMWVNAAKPLVASPQQTRCRAPHRGEVRRFLQKQETKNLTHLPRRAPDPQRARRSRARSPSRSGRASGAGRASPGCAAGATSP